MNKDSKIGVVGAGAMGSGIAQIAATAGHPVYLCDSNQEALEGSKANLKKVMDRLVEREKQLSKLRSEIKRKELDEYDNK